MPRKKNTFTASVDAPAPRTQPYSLEQESGWGGYINVRLSEKQTAEFRDWAETQAEGVYIYLSEVVADGIKFSLSYDPVHWCFIATLTGKLVKMSPDRFACSSRASSWEEAAALALYKHVVLAEGDYLRFGLAGQGFGSWG